MKKLPRKNKQWAEEAYASLQKSLILFNEEHPSPCEEEKLELISLAPLFAAMNRGISGKNDIEVANKFVLDNLRNDIANKDENEPLEHTILFLLAYMDSQVAFGEISEIKTDEVMEYIMENYEIPILA